MTIYLNAFESPLHPQFNETDYSWTCPHLLLTQAMVLEESQSKLEGGLLISAAAQKGNAIKVKMEHFFLHF